MLRTLLKRSTPILRSVATRHFAASAGAKLTAMTTENPYVDVVRYEHKNRVWSLHHVNYYSDALAIGIMENGLQPGDVVLSWLPEHLSEQMVLQFACAKAGLVLYTLDPSLAKKDPEASKQALAKALELTKANVLVSQEAGDDVNYINLAHQVIPELRVFDQSSGLPFVTPRFPHLRIPVQTGFDQDDKEAWLPLRHMIVPANNLDNYVSNVSGSSPLAGELVLDNKGIPTKLGATLTQDQVVQKKAWPTFCNILEKKFHEVEGVGVIF